MKIVAIIKSMRPAQWTKNLFVFAALIFARKFFSPRELALSVGAFLVFCLVSGAFYIFNDIRDCEEDRLHPKKCLRPIAHGDLGRGQAMAVFIVLSLIGLAAAFLLRPQFFYAVAVYLAIQLAYSLKLKHVVILDIFVIAAGFVIRVVAGGLVIDVPISSWLLICTTLLALLLAMGKRRHELILLEDKATNHRAILKEYSAYLLDQMIAVVTASTLIAYCLYTISGETVAKFGTEHLIWTAAFVLYGIFRYLYLVHQKGKGGSPEELILQDKPLLLNIVLWIGAVVLIIYLK
ncbi:MAG: phosphoribose diphosphate--decaprenyl-phosphate phosphoribosyltransferase [Candidatus Aminicenantes bacterium RBG_16_63_16]|nr:MAG: phosphoribose diphosphate--decaprenyl-phosphate phosphoribosyltransferase [Candidatus Aminicenantes bacterium RBG_16_63_16]